MHVVTLQLLFFRVLLVCREIENSTGRRQHIWYVWSSSDTVTYHLVILNKSSVMMAWLPCWALWAVCCQSITAFRASQVSLIISIHFLNLHSTDHSKAFTMSAPPHCSNATGHSCSQSQRWNQHHCIWTSRPQRVPHPSSFCSVIQPQENEHCLSLSFRLNVGTGRQFLCGSLQIHNDTSLEDFLRGLSHQI